MSHTDQSIQTKDLLNTDRKDFILAPARPGVCAAKKSQRLITPITSVVGLFVIHKDVHHGYGVPITLSTLLL
jgi:hypothetical protein